MRSRSDDLDVTMNPIPNPSPDERAADYRPVLLADAEALREHLDALNDAGESAVTIGYDSAPQPFLITLTGPYAEGESVFFDSPWAGHDITGADIHCDECRGEVCGIDHLRFPVTVMSS